MMTSSKQSSIDEVDEESPSSPGTSPKTRNSRIPVTFRSVGHAVVALQRFKLRRSSSEEVEDPLGVKKKSVSKQSSVDEVEDERPHSPRNTRIPVTFKSVGHAVVALQRFKLSKSSSEESEDSHVVRAQGMWMPIQGNINFEFI